MRALLLATALSLLASPLAAQGTLEVRLDSLVDQLTRASASTQTSQTRITEAQLLLTRYRLGMIPAGSGVWTMVLPLERRWRAVATVPADSGWATIRLDSAGIVRDSASVWMRPRP